MMKTKADSQPPAFPDAGSCADAMWQILRASVVAENSSGLAAVEFFYEVMTRLLATILIWLPQNGWNEFTQVVNNSAKQCALNHNKEAIKS